MTDIHHIHDKHFRESMSRKELAQDFLDNYLPPAVRRHVDLNTLSLCKDSFVSADKSTFYSDLLYKVATTSQAEAYIYLLFEHKSSPDRFTALQMLRYLVEIWEQYRKQHPACTALPLVIPLVIYHGKSAQKAITLHSLVHVPAPELSVYVPDFALDLLDFSSAADKEIKGQILTQLFLLCLRAKNQPKVAEYFRRVFVLLNQLDDSIASIEWIRIIISYMNQVMDVDKGIVIEMSKHYLSVNKEDTIMTLAEQWRQEGEAQGRMKGRMEGRTEGRMEGQATILSHQIAAKFGDQVFKKTVQEHVQNATPEQLALWAERILFATTIEEVFSEK